MPEAATPPVPPSPPVPPVSGGSERAPRGRAKDGPVRFAFLIEFAGPKNENIMCPIDSHVCRGRWSRKNLARSGTQIEGDFNGMPDLPGLCLLVNTEKRIVRRFDPLADPDNEKLMKRAQRIALAVTGTKMVAEKPKVWRERAADNNTVKTFVFWVRRLLDAEQVTVIKGHVPEFDELRKLPGVIQMQQFDQLAGIVRGVPDDAIRYLKPVPPDEEDGRDEEFMEDIPDPVINSDGMGFPDDRDDDGDDD